MAIPKIQTGLRLDEVTYNKLKYLSEHENRSLNNYVENVIKRHISDHERQHGDIPLVQTD